MKLINAYQADDGMVFVSARDAFDHNFKNHIYRWLTDHIRSRDRDYYPSDFLKYVKENKEIIRKYLDTLD